MLTISINQLGLLVIWATIYSLWETFFICDE